MSTILIVDDEEMIRKLVRRMVDAEGREILEAGSASEADTLMQGRGCDVSAALVDVSLPDINGADLAAQWLTEYPSLKVVLISGFPIESSSMVAGRMLFLQKPFTREHLQEALLAAGG